MQDASATPVLNDKDDIVWGAAAIGAEVNLSPAKAFYALEKGTLPGRKLGGRWMSRRSALKAATAIDASVGAAP
jgi:hypothetical protein